MLTNDDAALRNKRFGGGAFLIDIKPGIGVHDFHGHIRHDGTDAEEESSVAGNDLSVVVSADITDLHIAVGIEGIGRFSAERVPSPSISASFMPATTPDT